MVWKGCFDSTKLKSEILWLIFDKSLSLIKIGVKSGELKYGRFIFSDEHPTIDAMKIILKNLITNIYTVFCS